jgi:hypothetical protein
MSASPTNGSPPAPPDFYTAADGKSLFVPFPMLLRTHEATTLAAICARAGVSTNACRLWVKQHPWLEGWLYGGPLPTGVGNFRRTRAMLAFRRSTSIKGEGGIAAAVGKTGACLRSWLAQYHAKSWFRPWLLRGEEPPADVTVATEKQRARMAAWCDFASHCRRAGMHRGTYYDWLHHVLIPDLGWLQWLFGWPEPAGAFVVDEKLQRLRHEQTPMAICEAAGICYEVLKPSKGKRTRFEQVLAEACEIAAKPGHPSRDGVGADLPPERRRWIWAYADAATLNECCRRAGLLAPSGTATAYYRALRRARQLGVEAVLRKYLAPGPQGQGSKARQTGLVAPSLFVPSPHMLAFRKEASKVMVEQNIAGLRKDLPAFFVPWFEDWVLPQAENGQRIALVADASRADSSPENGPNPKEAAQLLSSSTDHAGATKRPSGRPPGPTKNTARFLDAWREDLARPSAERRFRSIQDAANASGIDRSTASKALKDAGLKA